MVREYSDAMELYKPEETILELLRQELKGFAMLDIGVGGGRTTRHFAPLVKSYVGIDYSPPMIESCRRTFPYDFRICDVRDMHIFGDSSFDFVLFSFNGIDSLNHEGRSVALDEIRRVIIPGGYYCFSTHNLNSLPELFALTANPVTLVWGIRVRIANGFIIRTKKFADFAFINNGVHRFRLKQHYVCPPSQIDDLRSHGFGEVRVFRVNGSEVRKEQLPNVRDGWMYYLCQAV